MYFLYFLLGTIIALICWRASSKKNRERFNILDKYIKELNKCRREEGLNKEKTSKSERCANCIHFGQVKGYRGVVRQYVCLAPITTEPPANGVTAAKNRFVYKTSPSSVCELWTENILDADYPSSKSEVDKKSAKKFSNLLR